MNMTSLPDALKNALSCRMIRGTVTTREISMPKSPEEMAQSMIRNMPEKTGRSLDEWLALCKTQPLEKHGEIVKFLKADHGMTHGFANLVAHQYRQAGQPVDNSPDSLIDNQYRGKESLRSIYDRLTEAISGFGTDVELSPKKAYVSCRRNKQFALLQPSTKTRLDVGINLKGEASTERLEDSGSFNSMVSHRVRITAEDEVDDALIGWLRQAYDNS